jgi:hypothetical protein
LASTINASNSGFGGIVSTGDSSGQLQLQTASTTALTLDTSQNATFAGKITSAGALTLASNGSTTAVTIDTSQNVGIGTTSPAGKFNVSYTNQITDAFGIANIYSTDTAATNKGGSIGLGGATGQAVANYVFGTIAGRYEGSGYAGYLQLSTTSSGGTVAERMRIDSSGNLLVGTTDSATSSGPGIKLAPSTTTSQIGIVTNTSTNPGTYHLYNTNATNNGFRFYVLVNGGIANFSANNANLSDARLKTDILPATTYLDKICSIPVVTFKYKDQNDEELNLGVIAQDVDKIAPELVNHNGFGETPEGESPYLSVYQTDLQYALMKCIQEQQTIINDLKARIETLEAK